MGIFARIRKRLFGKRAEESPLGQFRNEEERLQAERVVARARAAAQRSAQAENLGRQQAQNARIRGETARRIGDQRGAEQARKDEQAALDFAARQRRERQDQERRAREAEFARQQAVIEGEQIRAKARQALLKTRVEQHAAGDWGFQGPAPKKPEVYKNIKTGEGDIPDRQAFLLGAPYTAFASSNVMALQYDPRKGEMYIQYVKSGWYKYSNFSRREALQFYEAASKGIAVWDSIRVRGENPRLKSPPASTRKRFERNSPPPTDLPLESSAAAYGTQGGAGL